MKKTKRLLSLVLAVLMVLTCFTGPAFGTEKRKEGAPQTERIGAQSTTPPAEEKLPVAREGKGRGFQSLNFRTQNTYRYADDEAVTAIVLLEGSPAAELPEAQRGNAVTRMAAQRMTLRNSMRAAGIEYTEQFEYHTLLNGLAIRTTYGSLDEIASMQGVQSVHIANRYAPPELVKMESSNEMTGAFGFQRAGFTGSGTVIAVLDTGITPWHEAFQVWPGMLEQAAISEDDAFAVIDELGYGSYLSQKVPFAYDYADEDDDASDDYIGHGTHVSGIAAGYAETWDGAASFVGTAPDAQILAMKIFSDWGGGTDSSIYFKALEDAYLLGADVINMSIGAQNGFTWDQELEDEVFGNIYETLAENGVAVVVAAGNEDSMAAGGSTWAGPGVVTADYADYGVVGSPATYGRNLAVASAENAVYPMHYIEAGGRKIFFYDADGNQFFRAFGGMENVEFAVIPGCGTYEDFQGVMVRNRIALISRGEISFQEKIENAAEAGAAGALIYNNEDGPIYMAVDWYTVPAASITKEDGEYLLSLAETVEPEAETGAVKAAVHSELPAGMGWTKVTSEEELIAARYLLVNEAADRIFNGASDAVNSKGNYVDWIDVVDDTSLTLNPETGSLMTVNGLYLSGEAGANKIVLSEEEVPNEISFDEEGNVILTNNETQFAYNADWNGFRFYKNGSGVLSDSRSVVSLYRIDGSELDGGGIFEGTFTAKGNTEIYEGGKVVLYNPYSGMAIAHEDLSEEHPEARKAYYVEVKNNRLVDPDASVVWDFSFSAPDEAGEPVHLHFTDPDGNALSMSETGLVLNGENNIWNSRQTSFENALGRNEFWPFFNLTNDADDKNEFGVYEPGHEPHPTYRSMFWDEELGGFTAVPRESSDAFVFQYLVLEEDEPEETPFEGVFCEADHVDLIHGEGTKVILYSPEAGAAISAEAGKSGLTRTFRSVDVEDGIVIDPDISLVWDVGFIAPVEAGEPPHFVFRSQDGSTLSATSYGLMLDEENEVWNSHRTTNEEGEDEYYLVCSAYDRYGSEAEVPEEEPDKLSICWDKYMADFSAAPYSDDPSFHFRYLLLDDSSEPEVPEDAFTRVNSLWRGKEVVLYHTGSGMALSSEADGDNRVGVPVQPFYDNYYLSVSDPALIWTVGMEDGDYILTDSEGHRLSVADGGNSLPSDAEYDTWESYMPAETPEDIEGAFIYNTAAPAGSRGDPLALEYDQEHFTAGYLDEENKAFDFWIYSRDRYVPPIATDIGSISFPMETITVENENGWLMSDFSSWGVTPDLQLKPMITGIGGYVWSVDYGTENGYALMSGTSMATPNLSGAMADLLQYIRENYPDVPKEERRAMAESMLESSARILTNRDESDEQPYSPRKQGAGLVDLTNAAQARAYVENPVLSLGDSTEGTFGISFTIRSLYDQDVTYAIDVTALIDRLAGVDWDEDGEEETFYNTLTSERLDVEKDFYCLAPESVTVPANGSIDVGLTLVLTDEAQERFAKLYPNGNFIDGFVKLTEQDVGTKRFDDVLDSSKFYFEPVYWAVKHNPVITTGTSGTMFSPNKACTRAQVVTFLWRAAGEPEPKSLDCPFTDVKASAFYYKAMLWAVEQGITAGTSGTTFAPNKTATRGQVVTFLHRFAGEPEPASQDCPFTDVKASAFYYKAMLWAVAGGITNGTSGTTFGPGKACTRGHVVTFLYRLLADHEEKPQIHATFTGFFGDWAAAPILESHDWREIVDIDNMLHTTPAEEGSDETLADLGYSYLDAADFEVNTDVNMAYTVNMLYLFFGTLYGGYAGDNLFDYVPYNEARAAFSPLGIMDVVYAAPMMLRNARHLIMTVTDAETGELYSFEDAQYVPKAVYDTDYGVWSPTYGFLYDGTDLTGEYLPGGTRVCLSFYANPAWGGDALGEILGELPEEDPAKAAEAYGRLETEAADYLAWSFQVTVDDQAPTFSEVRYDPETGTLTATAVDDQFLAAAGLYQAVVTGTDEEGEEQTDETLVEMTAFGDETTGEAHTVVFENVEPGRFTLTAVDYAGNVQELTLLLSENGTLHTVTFSHPEDTYVEYDSDVFLVSEGTELILPDLESDLTEASFAAWLPQALEGTASYEELEAAGLVDQAGFPGDTITVTEDLDFFALFEYVSEWSDPEKSIRDCRENRADYSGIWAFGGCDREDYTADFFLDSSGGTSPEESVQEDGWTYLNDPSPRILFEITPWEEDGYYMQIRSLETGKYLSVRDGALTFTEADEASLWEIWWNGEDETACLREYATDFMLVFDIETDQFRLVYWDDMDLDSQWLLLYGSYPMAYRYFTDPAALGGE